MADALTKASDEEANELEHLVDVLGMEEGQAAVAEHRLPELVAVLN